MVGKGGRLGGERGDGGRGVPVMKTCSGGRGRGEGGRQRETKKSGRRYFGLLGGMAARRSTARSLCSLYSQAVDKTRFVTPVAPSPPPGTSG